jgi:hypothetical protein
VFINYLPEPVDKVKSNEGLPSNLVVTAEEISDLLCMYEQFVTLCDNADAMAAAQPC